MNQEVLQVLPEIGTVVGAIGGYALNAYALRHAEETQESIIENLGPISQESEQKIDRSTINKIVDFLLRKAAPSAVAAVALGIAPMAWLNNEAPSSVQRPTLQEVLDYSGQTGYDGALAREYVINNDFIGDNKLNVNVTLGIGGSFEEGKITPKSVQNINKYWPIGVVSMPEAVNAALGSSVNSEIPIQSNVIGADKNKSGALLVVTDGDSIGPVPSVIAQAEQDNDKLYIANVGNGNNSVAQGLKVEAQDTGGEYWNANTDTAKIAKEIVDDITPPGVKIPNESNNDWQNWLKVLDIASALSFVGITLNAASLVFNRNRNKELKGE